MNKKLLISTLPFVGLALGSIAAAEPTPAGHWTYLDPGTCPASASRGRVDTVEVHTTGLEHTATGEDPDRTVAIYLPPGYEEPLRRYPVPTSCTESSTPRRCGRIPGMTPTIPGARSRG